MEITIEFDYTQQELMGEKKVLSAEEGIMLIDFIRSVDALIEDACGSSGIDPAQKRILNEGSELNGCIASVNGAVPPGLLKYRLKDGDVVSLLYGYCGG